MCQGELRYKDREDFDDYEWLRCPLPKWRDPHERERLSDVYELMMKCWSIHPDLRPDFDDLREELEGFYHSYY